MKGLNMRATKRRLLLLGLVAFAGALACGVAIPGIRWRLQVIGLKSVGALPDLPWPDLVAMMNPHNGVWLAPLADAPNPFEVIRNPRTTPSDVAAGSSLFRTNCSECHGDDARGKSGPDLSRGEFSHGASDWAIYRTITRGVPGTAMTSRELPRDSVWQVVAYLRSLETATTADLGTSEANDPNLAIDVSFDQLRAAGRDPGWLTYSGSYDAQRYSRLSQITRENVSLLRLKWIFQLPDAPTYVQNTPLVVGNMMFVTLPPRNVWALDTRTGEVLWEYRGSNMLPDGLQVAVSVANRGVAVFGGIVYLTTIDAHLVALDARTGQPLWDTVVADYKDGYSITGAPLAVGNKIIVGVAGGEYGIRGFLDAYDAETGKRVWRFHTVPGPGDPGHETWGPGDGWETGGAPTWLTGSYDPELDLIYWGVGNPSPDFDGDSRAGDNLYSNCMIAVEAATGRLRWHYQFTPHDEHDWDATEIPVLADLPIDGQQRKVLLQANRNGIYYVLDRITGQFISGHAFVKQTWLDHFDPDGRPVERPLSRPTADGTLAYPGATGATNWWSPAFDPKSNTFFVPTHDGGSIYFKSDEVVRADGKRLASTTQGHEGELKVTAVRALDAVTGALRWKHAFAPNLKEEHIGGVLATSGDLVFGGHFARFFALDGATGEELWHSNIGGILLAGPITYMSDGEQLVTAVAGSVVVTFSLDTR